MDNMIEYFYSDGNIELMFCKFMVYMFLAVFMSLIFGSIRGLMSH